ncbi:ADP-ribosylglycohydrolase [Mytilinidion resinicola]|uniref:ADP-ribosylhydrolase ARH3 n=1 Tax=Mytilinidion resinicola TaxID=574789 RepID=A0A6A6Z897_9PEZI|nr:ADP-ribosylglycohydrolase [Mytilinidion resinicola]KAF2817230.1 ADP-ribosylglycohydrolase [Mytilinidion resinicola]
MDPPITSSRQSRILGALLGLHSGDSLGATLEFRTWSSIRAKYPTGLRDIVGGGAFRWSAGHATDDTDMTRAVLLAYRDRVDFERAQEKDQRAAAGEKDFNGSAVAELRVRPAYLVKKDGSVTFDVVRCAADYMVAWSTGTSWPGRKPGSQPVDIGGATQVGLAKYQQTRDPRKAGAGPDQAGNGSLMRCLPTGLFGKSREERVRESIEISAVTHDDRRCTVACAVYNEIAAALVDGVNAVEAIEIGLRAMKEVEGLDCKPVELAVKQGKTISVATIVENGPGPELPGKAGGYVLESLTLAIAAILDQRTLEDVLVDVLRVGKDTDTNGAIAGGLLGARDGIEAVPERWKLLLQFRVEFEDIVRGIEASN